MPNLRIDAYSVSGESEPGLRRAVILVLALVAAATATACDSQDENRGLPPFYLEARMEGTDFVGSVGTNIAGDGAVPGEPRLQEIRWLNLDRDHMRVEIETLAPKDSAGPNIISADGDNQYVYFGTTNTYSRSPLFDIPDGETIRIRPWSFGALIGPWYGDATTLDEFMEQLKKMGGSSADVRAVGEGTILGMPVSIVEVSPVSTSYSSDEGESRHGVARYWVSLDRMVILKQEVIDEQSQNFVIEVTELEWSPKNRGGVELKPPPGATLEQQDSGPSSGAITPSGSPSR